MARASLGGLFGCALLSLVLGSGSVDFGAPPASFYPRFNPFFFLCTHHGELEGAGVAEGGGEVLLTLQITGSPTAYTPGQEYQDTIAVSVYQNEMTRRACVTHREIFERVGVQRGHRGQNGNRKAAETF
ncbi:Reelin [Oryzias melastigma]|uniref:Reelin n=1 Tax=Oryzias melastigma TaxID=30732 RepID=A0A834BV52_ORYME|nr:Reelin [Oryzias melastigma]